MSYETSTCIQSIETVAGTTTHMLHYRSTAECPDVVVVRSCAPVATATLECSVFYRTAEKGSRNSTPFTFVSIILITAKEGDS